MDDEEGESSVSEFCFIKQSPDVLGSGASLDTDATAAVLLFGDEPFIGSFLLVGDCFIPLFDEGEIDGFVAVGNDADPEAIGGFLPFFNSP